MLAISLTLVETLIADQALLPSLSGRALDLPGASGCCLRAGQVDLDALAPGWRDPLQAARVRVAEQAVRRGWDMILSLAGLLLASPVLLIVAALVKLDSNGPVLYRQERSGLDGRPFTLLKFRSMCVDAEANGPCWASEHDPRVTPLGRVLRLTHLDELPQLFNVLAGSMSLVGPRPERPHFVEQLTQAIPHFGDRLAVKSGVTGWAQVNYPYGASVEDARQKLAYDLFYIQNRSLLLDFKIMFATVGVMLHNTGAR